MLRRFSAILALCCLAAIMPATAQDGSRLDRVLDTIVANERSLAETLEQYRPLFETYLQTVKPDPVLGSVPVKDSYFLGRLELPRDEAGGPNGKDKKKSKKSGKKTLPMSLASAPYSMRPSQRLASIQYALPLRQLN